MFAYKVFNTIASALRSNSGGAKPSGSFMDQAGKKLLAFGVGTATVFTGCSYMSIHRLLETRKYVDQEKIEMYIPADRNIFGNGAELNTDYAAAATIEAIKTMSQIRDVVQDQVDDATRRRYNDEANTERKALLSTWLFKTHQEETDRIMKDVLPYFFSSREIALLAQAAEKQKKKASS